MGSFLLGNIFGANLSATHADPVLVFISLLSANPVLARFRLGIVR